MWIYLLTFFVLLSGCGSHSMEDFREEGRAKTRKTLYIMKAIQSREDLKKAKESISDYFIELTELMIAVKKHKETRPESVFLDPTDIDHTLSEELENEMHRLMSFEEGEELLEQYQQEALYQLDYFEKMTESKKQRAIR